MTRRFRSAFLSLLALVLMLAASGCDLFYRGDDGDQNLPNTYALAPSEDDIFPEGIAYDPVTTTFFVGSTTDGTIYRGRLNQSAARAFSEGGAAAVGLSLGRVLWVAGGMTGEAYAVDPISGALLTTFSSPAAEATFINDAAAVEDENGLPSGTAYFTDSARPVLFRAALTGTDTGALEPWLDLTETPITYEEGFDLNGIVSAAHGSYLIVVQSNTGQLFRIDTETKAVQEIDLSGQTVTNGDGLVLSGQTLYVVRNANAEIVPVALSEDYLTGTVGAAFAQGAGLLFPTTAARAAGDLLVVNGQLDVQGGGTPELPFTVSRVEIP